jgi:hypothetical protein
MRVQHALPVQRKMFTVWLWILTGLSMVAACGGGSGGGTSPSSANAPTASISSPSGTYFKEGENITFSGSATDAGGTQLTGSALVWTSNIDGQIGTGETLITSALSAGDHVITLTATDAAGAIATASLPTISLAQTRFIKMGAQTTDVTDASNAFDGDNNTAATLMTPDTEYIYFKARIGTDDRFFFKIKLGGVSTTGSKLSIEGLATAGSWQFVSDVFLFTEKTITVEIANAQDFTDTDGCINLRAYWVNGQSPDTVPIYEIWRIDPPYLGTETLEVTNAGSAFDESQSSFAAIATPWNPLNPQGNQNYLHFKAYVGLGISDTFTFNILMNNIGASHSFAIYVEDFSTAAPGDWKLIETLALDSDSTRTVTIPNAQNYLDANGYISLRGSWTTVSTVPPGSNLKIYEIWRVDPFFVGPGTADSAEWIDNPQNAVDGDLDTLSAIYYFWGEFDRHDFLHVQAYAGETSAIAFSITTGPYAPGSNSELIVEGEREPDSWSVIQRIGLDQLRTTDIDLQNARQYINANGLVSLRVRWESDSVNQDAYVYEIQRKTN